MSLEFFFFDPLLASMQGSAPGASRHTVVRQHSGNGSSRGSNELTSAGRDEKAPGPEHPFRLTCVGNLASVLQDQGRYEAVERVN